jgi:hypothetical protein
MQLLAASSAWANARAGPTQVLVLDVSSMINSATLATSSVEDCEAYCNITPSCDGYDWCDSASGCGAYCIDHNQRNPAGEQAPRDREMPHFVCVPSSQVPLTTVSCRAVTPNPDDPTTPNPAWELPLEGLGPFGSTSK